MFDIVVGSILAFGSVLCCFFFFLGGSYIGMFCTVITLIIGLFFVGKSIFGDSSKNVEEEIESETCYGVLQYYTNDVSAQVLVYVPSIGNVKMIPYEFGSTEHYAIGTCFVLSYQQDTFEVEELISYGDVPEDIRSSLVVYPNPNQVVSEEPKLYSSLEQNS